MEGKFIAQVGGMGSGPGEYSAAADFHVDEIAKTITIIDSESFSFIVYDLNTYRYISRKQVPFSHRSYILLPDGYYAWCIMSGFKKAKDLYYVQITDSLFNITDYFLPADFARHYGIWVGDNFYTFKKKTYFYKQFDPVVYEITNKEIKPYYQFHFNKDALPSLDYLISISPNDNDYHRELWDSEYIYSYSFFETEQFILLSYLVDKAYQVIVYDKQERKSRRYADFPYEAAHKYKAFHFIGTYKNSFIAFIESSDIDKPLVVNIDDLNLITEKKSQEDNPILCLIQFK
jgi:hypothetical protein